MRGLFYSGAVFFLLVVAQQANCQQVIRAPFENNSFFQIAVGQSGVCKVTGTQLAQAGFSLPVSSNTLRLLGNGFSPLPSAVPAEIHSSLQEIAIEVFDGNDGIFHTEDYFLFYACHQQTYHATADHRVNFETNPYDTLQYYFLINSPASKRVVQSNYQAVPTTLQKEAWVAYRHEKDSFNLLSSGLQWWGDFLQPSFSGEAHRTFVLPFQPVQNSALTIKLTTASRSFNVGNTFSLQYGNERFQYTPAPVENTAYALYAQQNTEQFTFTGVAGNNILNIGMQSGSINGQGWIDYWEAVGSASLQTTAAALSFFTTPATPAQAYQLELNAPHNNYSVWNITRSNEPEKMISSVNESFQYQFTGRGDTIQQYIFFDVNRCVQPLLIRRHQPQNLFEPIAAEYLILSPESFQPVAEKIAAFHQARGLLARVVLLENIILDFGAGKMDPAAIRNFLAWQYRSHLPAGALQYVLLLGTGHYDYIGRNTSFKSLMPAFQSMNSLDPLSTYTSDDYYGILESGSDLNTGGGFRMQISVGRIPARNIAELEQYWQKYEQYHSSESFGAWKQRLLFVADDEDLNLHIEDAEFTAAKVPAESPFLLQKLYLDAYPAKLENGVKTFPGAVTENLNQLNRGVLLWNYNGHGGYFKLAEESIIDQQILQQLNNAYRLPLVVTATCNFAPHDQPDLNAVGTQLLLQPKTGAVAVLSTTRIVYASSNRLINAAFMEALFDSSLSVSERTVGKALQRAKNIRYQQGDITNNAKFSLLGDPALQLFPQLQDLHTRSLTVKGESTDTLKATNEYILTAGLQNSNTSFGREATGEITVVDKPVKRTTLGNSPQSPRFEYYLQNAVIYKGQSATENDHLQARFIVPKDIQYQYDKGKILYYAHDAAQEYAGVDVHKVIGGTGDGQPDEEGPAIQLFLDDEKFVSGSITNEQPLLIVKLKDSSGINILGLGLGHDITATINQNADQVYVLNNYYETSAGNNRAGTIRYQLPVMKEGFHQVTVKAWDVFNQSSEKTIDFQVVNRENFTLEQVFNYPNPFTTNTNFWFQHNRAGEQLQVSIEIYTVSGKLVKTFRETIFSEGNRCNEINWNGRDEYGNKLGRGVYIYKLTVKTADHQRAVRYEKLFLL